YIMKAEVARVIDVEFLFDMGAIGLYSLDTQMKLLCDLSYAGSPPDPSKHLQFAVAEMFDWRLEDRPRALDEVRQCPSSLFFAEVNLSIEDSTNSEQQF